MLNDILKKISFKHYVYVLVCVCVCVCACAFDELLNVQSSSVSQIYIQIINFEKPGRSKSNFMGNICSFF